jgi:hypothetical protein
MSSVDATTTTMLAKKMQISALVVTKGLAAARRGQTQMCEFKDQMMMKVEQPVFRDTIQKMSEKKDSAKKIYSSFFDLIWLAVGAMMLFHGCNFTNLFLCYQVIVMCCWNRLHSKAVSFYNHLTTGLETNDEGEKKDDENKDDRAKDEADTEAKDESGKTSKHAQKRASKKTGSSMSSGADAANLEEDAAAFKDELKKVDASRLSDVVFELCLAFAACHMAMESRLGTVIAVTYALVCSTKPKIEALLDFEDCDDVKDWTDLVLSLVLYTIFGMMAAFATALAIALNVCLFASALVLEYGLRVPQIKSKVDPDGKLLNSQQGSLLLMALVLLGLLKQMILPGMAWYFKLMYFPLLIAEAFADLF